MSDIFVSDLLTCQTLSVCVAAKYSVNVERTFNKNNIYVCCFVYRTKEMSLQEARKAALHCYSSPS